MKVTLSLLALSGLFFSGSGYNAIRPNTRRMHDGRKVIGRRAALHTISFGAFLATMAGGAQFSAAEEPDPRNLNAFNTLPFAYRKSEFGGLKASDIEGDSISYADFLKAIDSGEVLFVEFLAPDGDVAFATLKGKEGESPAAPIRIGEGFPVEIHDGWSSPAFAIRTVKEKGIPYKFTVPGLEKYK
eukprot:CAMPEP_0196804640 /NCGR_PEP_ID=MMETSP1362-20130617/4298_1 /TAXON_ID=163516 /ORGANISM="Leptocylindrus danicus, Strain CCMP1856" /LENGTH=185 /DNA_ID=CAMNT_0042177081 /DNA_START=36 /DNA_END=593 /DNA_ORIENTATION=-